MDWYKSYRLVKDPDGDGYTVVIYLDTQSPEFSKEFLSDVKENVLKLDDRVKDFVADKFGGIKINAVKLVMGTMIVASIPFFLAPKAHAATTSAVTASQTAGVTSMNTYATVTVPRLNMRTGPSTGYSVMHVLWYGNRVKVIARSGDWYKLKLSDGRTGWSSGAYLRVDWRLQKVNSVISIAKSYLGTPYVWGGESPAEGGFDCSGFTQYVFKQVGYSLNRISADQAKQGYAVSRANLQPGDLVFSSIGGSGNIDHVGIYIGGGMMIHSPKTGDVVKQTDITTSYWVNHFVTARRIITG